MIRAVEDGLRRLDRQKDRSVVLRPCALQHSDDLEFFENGLGAAIRRNAHHVAVADFPLLVGGGFVPHYDFIGFIGIKPTAAVETLAGLKLQPGLHLEEAFRFNAGQNGQCAGCIIPDAAAPFFRNTYEHRRDAQNIRVRVHPIIGVGRKIEQAGPALEHHRSGLVRTSFRHNHDLKTEPVDASLDGTFIAEVETREADGNSDRKCNPRDSQNRPNRTSE